MPTVAKPDEVTDALNAPTLDYKMALVNKMAESKVSLDADAIPVQSVPRDHSAHSRLSVPRPRVAQSKLALPNPLPWVLSSLCS